MPTSETTITVEQALAELREMFPQVPETRISIRRHESWFLVGKNGLVWGVYVDALMRQGPTLDEAMAQIRAWKERNHHDSTS